MKTFLYPIIFESSRIGKFDIAPEIRVRHITAEERRKIFGLNSVVVDFATPNNTRYIKQFSYSKKYSGMFPAKYFFEMPGLISNISEDIISSNYIVEVDVDGSKSPDYIIEDFNLALKLFKLTSSGISIGFEEGFKSGHFTPPSPFNGPFEYLRATKNDIKSISNYYDSVTKLKNDAKFDLVKKLYIKSLQGGKFDLQSSFLLLTTILEILYLDGAQAELSFKLAIRCSKLFNKLNFMSTSKAYYLAKEIYKCRSDLTHIGKSRRLTGDLFHSAAELTRLSLIAYTQKPDFFQNDILEKLCIL